MTPNQTPRPYRAYTLNACSCGNTKPELIEELIGSTPWYFCLCEKCGAISNSFSNPAEAIADWNGGIE